MFLSRKQHVPAKTASTGVGGLAFRCLNGAKFHLSENISPVRAFLVIFYAILVVGGLLQTDFSPNGKLTSPHSHDSGLAEVSEIEAESKVETELLALTPNWTIPTFEVSATPVVSVQIPVTSTDKYSVFLLRGPPVA